MSDIVAILLATYNGEKYLEEQIDSILNQTYKDIKIYIGDDCSKDGTIDIIKKYKSLYPNKIIFYQNDINMGFIKNFEKLLKLADEDYLAFCDQDDIWLPFKLEKQIQIIKNKEKQEVNMPLMVHSDLTMVDKNKNIICASFFKFKKYKLKTQKDLGHILGPCGVMGNTIMINKKLKNIILPFPKEIKFHDYYIAIMCELFGKRITLFENLILYRIHNDNVSNSKISLSKNRDLKLPYLDRNMDWINCITAKINENDLLIIKYFQFYVKNPNHFFNYLKLVRYNMVKRDFVYRIKLFLKFLVKIYWKK